MLGKGGIHTHLSLVQRSSRELLAAVCMTSDQPVAIANKVNLYCKAGAMNIAPHGGSRKL